MKDTVWYLPLEALKSEPQCSLSALFHSIRDSKVSAEMSFFETVNVPEVAATFEEQPVRLIMIGLGSSETKVVVDSELAVGHLALKVADLKSSCQFYAKLGIPPFAIEEKVAIIELRGGTHLLLLEVDYLAGEGIAQSLTGQFHQKFSEQFDLMIKGKGLDELKKYRFELVSRGIAVGEIPDETFFGHHLFCVKDPDGNGITIYTSHAIHLSESSAIDFEEVVP